MNQSLELLVKGMTLGFSAGIAPGPLTFLVITQTLQYNWREGFKVAIAPLITDLPIILVCCFLLLRLSQFDVVIGLISLLGAYFLIRMALENWRAAPPHAGVSTGAPGSLIKGILANLFNPHPYLFWLTVGAPLIMSRGSERLHDGSIFIIGMFSLMIGVKVVIALALKHSRSAFSDSSYRLFLRGSALALGIFAVTFIREGFMRLGLIS